MDARFLQTLQESHLSVWNERDRTKRDELIKTIYAEDIKMCDKDFIFHGIKEISDFIDKLHTQDPQFHFSPARDMEASQNGIRLFWNIRMGQEPGLMTGMDFFLVEEGKVVLLYVFMDAKVI